MSISQIIAGLRSNDQSRQQLDDPSNAALPHSKFVDHVLETAMQLAEQACQGKRFDKYMVCYERPTEYRGPELSDKRHAAFYLYNSGRAEFGSDKSPGIIAVEISRQGGQMRVLVNSDRPEDPVHKVITDQLNTQFPDAVKQKQTLSESVGQFFIDQVARLAREELKLSSTGNRVSS